MAEKIKGGGWAGDELWLVNTRFSCLSTLDHNTGDLTTVAQLPGFARGLTFHGNYAFVGLSKIRETAMFGDLPITKRLDENERKCGIWIVDITTGQIVSTLEFETGVEEIFDVQVLPGIRFPAVIGFERDTINGTSPYTT